MGKCNQLPSRSSDQPPCSRLSFCNEESKHFKINPLNVWSLRNNSQSGDGSLHSKSIHREASSFKFSVSRLPKWAQTKVTSCNNVCRNPNYTSSEAYSPSSPEVQIPSDRASLLPETVNSQCSSRPRSAFNNIALDNHWLSVYTVCMDALSSPDRQNVLDTKFPKIPWSLRQDGAVISKDQNSSGLSSLGKNEKMSLVLDKHVSCNNNDSSWCSEQVYDRKAEQLHLDESGSTPKKTLEDNLDSLCCEEDSDIFKRHFGSLSNTHKPGVSSVQTESRNSLVRRFSARYIVQRDYPGGYQKLFSSPVGDITISKSSEEAVTHIISGNRSLQVMKIKEDLKNSALGLADSTHELIRCPVKENSVDNQLGLGRDQKEGGCEGGELQETIAACKKAFGNLDAAAESAVQLFSKLEKSHCEEVSRGAGAQFLNEAAELLPRIVEKLNAVARLVQCWKKNKCLSRLGVPE